MKKKLLTIAMAFCLIATMMPIYTGVAFAWEGNSGDIQILGGSYDLGSNNAGYLTTTTDGTGTTTLTQVGNNDNWNIKIAKGTEEHTYAITLSGAAIKSSESETCGIIVSDQYNSANKVTITLVGTNTIETSGSAINTTCDVEIKGDGTLIATGNGNTDMQHGIKAVALAITGNATVEATGGEHGDGILASSLTVSGKKVTATGGSNGNGIFCDTGDIIISGTTTSVSAIGGVYGIRSAGSEGGKVEIKGGANVTATGTNVQDSVGISAIASITISGANTIVSATGDSIGIDAPNDKVQISGGAKATATANATLGIGIHAKNGITISDATVSAIGGQRGIQSEGDVQISGGTVTAEGSNSAIDSNGDVQISGGAKVTATSTNLAGIWADKDVIISGATTSVSAIGNTYGIGAYDAAQITGGAIVTAKTSGTLESGTFGKGIYTANNLSIGGAGTTVVVESQNGFAMSINGDPNVPQYDGVHKIDIFMGADESQALNNGRVTKCLYSNDYGSGYVKIVSTSTSLKKLAKPIVAWGSSTPGAITWQKVDNVSQYTDVLYKDSIAVSSGQSNSTWLYNDYTSVIKREGAGSYTFTVQAIGDGITYASSDIVTSSAYNYTPAAPSTPSPSRPSSPTINISGGQADAAGGTAVFDPATKALTINPAAGFTVKEVLVNGQSKGAVTSLTDVSVYDRVEVVFEKIPEKTPEQIQAEKDAKIKAGVKATTISLSAKARAKGIKLTWEKSKGYKVDKYLIYRNVNGGKYKLYKTTTSTSFTNSKVTEGKVYRFKVKGVRTVGDDKVYTETSKVIRVRAK